MTTQRIIPGDCIEGLRTLPDASVHCCVTSPPYWGLRDYGHAGQIGLEDTPEAYVVRMVEVFREVRRVLRDDGTLWLNLGDSYCGGGGYAPDAPCNQRRAEGESWGAMNAFSQREGQARKKSRPGYTPPGLKPKDLVGIPWRVAFALQSDGWWLRQDIIWHKPNPMPESVRDRCTKSHEYVFLFAKGQRYFYDAEAIHEKSVDKESIQGRRPRKHHALAEVDPTGFGATRVGFLNGRSNQAGTTYPTRNRRSVWTITTKPYSGAHFAVMPPDLVEPCIKAGTSEGGCCSACGKPRERVVARERTATRPGTDTKVTGDSLIDGNRDPERHVTATTTLGWRPACTCGGLPAPCTVLDPFAGSGTTLAVAAELGRNAVGCELNTEYIGLAKRRIKDARGSVALFEGVPA